VHISDTDSNHFCIKHTASADCKDTFSLHFPENINIPKLENDVITTKLYCTWLVFNIRMFCT